MNKIGYELYDWAKELWPICRSLTGSGVRDTLNFLAKILQNLEMHEVKTGSQFYDWKVPKEWSIKDAWIKNSNGKKLVDFKKNNLHVVGYSTPINATMSYDELAPHIHSIEALPDAVPYITSYYEENWGFCIPHNERKFFLNDSKYHVYIDSELKDGILNYADLVIPGSSKQEILFSTYICHPSMANNELSGPLVATALARWLQSLPSRRYTYRFVFVPETIGSIVYIHQNFNLLKERTIAGFVLTCMGDNAPFSYLPSIRGNTLADRVAISVLSQKNENFIRYTFLDRGSDERQYCSPLVDLPVASIMRSKYGEYKEYHTSHDDLSFISPDGLGESFELMMKCVLALEGNRRYITTTICEPQLSKRGLYPPLSTRDSSKAVAEMMNVLAYADGQRDCLDLVEAINLDVFKILEICKTLEGYNLLRKIDE